MPSRDPYAHSKAPLTAEECLNALKLVSDFLEDLRTSNPGYLGKMFLQDYEQMNLAFVAMGRCLDKAPKPVEQTPPAG